MFQECTTACFTFIMSFYYPKKSMKLFILLATVYRCENYDVEKLNNLFKAT